MAQQVTSDQVAVLGQGLPCCLLDELLNVEINSGIPESLLPFLRCFDSAPEFASGEPACDNDQPREHHRSRDAGRSRVFLAAGQPLQKVAAGPWRSLGGYFDYSGWVDRERFLELDRAIARDGDGDEPEDGSDLHII